MRVPYKVASSYFPDQGGRCLPVVLDFTASGPGATGTLSDDLFMELAASKIESINNVYIDNSLNPTPLSLFFPLTQCLITAQEFSQGIYPVKASGRMNYIATTNPGTKINVLFGNMPESYQVWPCAPTLSQVVLNSTSATILAVPAVAGTIIRVRQLLMVVGAAGNFTFNDGLVNALSGPMPLTANGSIILDEVAKPWYTTSSGNAFVILNPGAVQVSGTVWYTQTPN